MLSIRRPLGLMLIVVYGILLLSSLGARNIFTLDQNPIQQSIEYVEPLALEVSSRAGILFDADSGTVLFEKNPTLSIPPASITKLMTMALVFEHLAQTGTSPDSLIQVPPEAWSVNAPPGSSLMFLGRGHRTTWHELLLGLAVASGNDAAIAAAINVSGSVPAFVDAMNFMARERGLSMTRFVEPSGYDGANTTTALDLGKFIAWYHKTYPGALAYHGTQSFDYPQAHNVPPGADWVRGPIRQYNRNRLLWDLPGTLGLKTGFIEESGYNLAFSVRRDGMTLMGVLLGAPDEDARAMDAQKLSMEAFARYRSVALLARPTKVPLVYGGTINSLIVPSQELRTTIEARYINDVRVVLEIPEALKGPFGEDAIIGRARWYSQDVLLAELPLRAGTKVEKPWAIYGFFENLYLGMRGMLGLPAPASPLEYDLNTSP